MGGATGVGKIRTVRSVKRQRSANCLRIPAKTISYLSKLRKVWRSGVKSRSFVRCCRYESSLKHFIFLAHRMSLQLAIRATQEEAGEREQPCKGISCSGVLLTRARCDGAYASSYRRPRARVLARGGLCQCCTTDKHRLFFVFQFCHVRIGKKSHKGVTMEIGTWL